MELSDLVNKALMRPYDTSKVLVSEFYNGKERFSYSVNGKTKGKYDYIIVKVKTEPSKKVLDYLIELYTKDLKNQGELISFYHFGENRKFYKLRNLYSIVYDKTFNSHQLDILDKYARTILFKK